MGGVKATTVLEKLKAAGSFKRAKPRVRCPLCKYRWTPQRTDNPEWCPKCHRNLKEDRPVRKPRPPAKVSLLDDTRFTPGAMKRLCTLGLYRYGGIPLNLPSITAMRAVQRKASLQLANQYFTTELSGLDMADTLGIRRQAFYQRIEKGFQIMVERGSFQLTQKGKEQLARELKAAGLGKTG